MALAGELAKYIGGELVKNTGKELATKAATSALSNLAPKIATKAGAKMATGSVLSSLVPSVRTNWENTGDIEGMLNGKFLGTNDNYFPSVFSEGALGRATYGADQPIDQRKVAGLVRAIKNNEDIAPIAGFKNNDGLIDIYDGHHRLAAYRKAGKMPRVKLFDKASKEDAYNYADEWAKDAIKKVQQYLPAKPEAGLDEYGMGTIDLRDLNTPKVQQSIDDSYITLYHGTPNKFEDFDESLPSVWFSDSDKNLRDTGLSIKGGQSMNIMKRQLPKDLKIADEDLADRLTRQQLQDRGYAGIAYTERGPNGDETYYEIFKPNETLQKTSPEVIEEAFSNIGGANPTNNPRIDRSISYSYDGYGSSGGFAKDVKAIGTKDVAPIDPETLPEGYDFYRKVSEKNKAKYGWVYDEVSKATGKPARRITNADLRQFLEDNYPDYVEDGKMTKYELEQRIQDAMEDELTDEAWENGADLSALVHNKYPRAGIRDIYNDHSGRTGKLDRELSRRLGIGESTSVMMDRLNNDTGRAAGDVSENRVGIKFDNWSSDEDKVGVMGHERLHLFQNASKRNNFDYEQVKPVYQKLHDDLQKALLNEEEIRKIHSGSEFERMGGMSYWGSDIEQEARMLEAYLYSEGYVKARPYRIDEFASKMNIIKPAFDKFFKKLRALSKKGIALPAIAGLVGIGALANKKDNKSVDNIE